MKPKLPISKKIISIICILSILAFLIPKKTFSNTKTNYTPEFYGTTNITIKLGDNLDLKSSFYRIFAKDFEDGNLTKDIKVIDNTVNTAKEGTYEISYEVIDSDGNKATQIVPVNVVADGERKIQRTLYTLPDISYMNITGFNRGNNHDKQDLGIYLPADASVSVKQVNDTGKDLVVQFLNNDVLKESVRSNAYVGASKEAEEINFMKEHQVVVYKTDKIISKDLNGVTTLQNVVSVKGGEKAWDKYDGKSFASVPFVKTLYDTKGVSPIIEITLNDSVKPLDYYTYGDSMEEFKKQWNTSNNEVAVLEGDRVTFLVPYKDLEYLGKSKKIDNNSTYQNDAFNSIDDLLIYYDNLIEEFDEWVGLSYTPSKSTDQNIKTKYFIKANIHGYAYAVYSINNYIYRTDYSLDTFLHNVADGWAPLHEIGHGYQSTLKEKNLALREVSNNILSYYYQKENLQGSWFGNIADMEKEIMKNVREKEESYLVENGNANQGTENVDIYHLRLYAYINLLNKIGPKKSMAEMYSYYREEFNNASLFVQLSNAAADVLSIGFSNSSGYNVIPYFNEWKLSLQISSENEIYNKDYPIVYFLRDLVKDDDQAEKIREELNLEGIYSLVSNEDISKYNLKGTINFNLNEEEFNNLKGYDIILKSGENVIKQIRVTSANITIPDVPIGAYEIECSRKDKNIFPKYAVSKQDEINNVTITTKSPKLTKISITNSPTKTKYTEGESFDTTGMIVKAIYDNGDEKEITNYTIISGDNLKKGQISVFVSYTEDEVTKKVSQLITVAEKLEVNLGNYKETTKGENTYLKNISSNTKISEFKENIQTNGTIEIYKETTPIIDTNIIIATGMKMKINDSKEYILVVKGELNSDGKADITDLGIMARYIVGKGNLNTTCLLAGDINYDGKVDITDLSILAMAITREVRL